MTQNKIIGLTGGSGSGKSTVARLLCRQKGVFVIDADKIGHDIMLPGGEAYDSIISHFGSRILSCDGTIDRKKLRLVVFSDKCELEALNTITHPIIAEISKNLASNHKFSVIDAALLFDCKPILSICSKTIVVCAPIDVRINRIMARDNLSETEAKMRINAQRPQEELIRLADFVIENSGSQSELTKRIDEVWTWLSK